MVKRRIVAMFLSLVIVASMFMGNTNLGMVTQLIAAEALNAPANLSLEEKGEGFQIKWDSYNGATRYDVYRSKSRYGNYERVATVDGLTWTDTNPNAVKYENYYKVAVEGSGSLSEPISLEMEMFGNGMYIFSPNDDINQVYNAVNDVFKIQGAVDENGKTTDGGQFSTGRYALAFKPGDYTNIPADMFNMSYYMQLLGLGELPTEVKLKNVHVPPVLANNNVTCNFWMGIENLSISQNTNGSNDPWFAFNWSVSQAAPARRLYVQRTMNLNYLWEGWASGGYVADSIIDAAIGSWSQQQYYLRNNNINGDFYGVNWNFVTQGCTGIYGDNWNNTLSKYPMYDLESGLGQTNWKSGGKYTVLDKSDALREKPFLYYDTDVNEYKVFAPAMRRNAKGTSWSEYGNGQGTTYDISDFYIARADRDNAASINAALDAGKNIILTPGIYKAEEPINIKRANTIVLGLGLATIIPDNKETGIKIADVDGVTLAGVIIDADSYSKNMLVVGPSGSNKDHSGNPTIIQDVFVRVGGVHGGVASTEDALVINSNDVIGDHFWIWRADHGAGVGWYSNTANNGVVVNGDDVTLYGLMVEHFQKYDVLWRGENGRTYFLQNEKAYDPQKQEEWMSHEGTVKGYASYKVANNVDNHYAVGLGMYDVFINTNGASIFLDNAVEVPNKPGVMIENACIVEIANGEGPIVGINSIVNGTAPGITTGTGSGGGYARQACILYNNGISLSLPNYYLTGNNDNFGNVLNEQRGIEPTYDPVADDYVESEPEPEPEPEPDVPSIATGPYADWKNGAITYPGIGQLVAAGKFDVEFSRLDGAVKYDVYVDNALVKTISGTDAKANDFSVEYYSVDVDTHKVYVVATMPGGSKISSNIRTFYISKKGMGIWEDDAYIIDDTNLSWYYTWSLDEITGIGDKVEFVPMVWGNFGTNSNIYNWLNNGEYLDYNYLLTFNEPDRADQANMTPERAVELWPMLQKASDAGVSVGSPATSSPHVLHTDTNNDYGTVGGWYGKYENLMVGVGYHDDFTTVHFYFDYPGDFVLDIIEQIHEDTGKPIWITEWGVAQWSQIQNFDWTGGPDTGNWQRQTIANFLYSALPKLDQMDFVERYAWFPFDGSDTSKYGNGAGGIFFNGADDPLNGQLTAVGKAYAELGLPADYNPDVVTQDVVVDDGEVENPPTDPSDGEESDDKESDDEEETTGKDTEEPTSGEIEEPTTNSPSVERENVVIGKSATASTVLGGNLASYAVDGNTGSRWETIHNAENPQWLQIDLAGTYYIDSFKIVWETAAAVEYEFQVSTDGTSWNPVCTITDGVSGQTREESFAEVEAKYVRILCKSKTTGYGYSIWEMAVYGTAIPSNPITTIDGGIEINGYQISTTVGGMRTIYSVDSQINGKDVVSSGIVYSLADYAPEDELYVGSNNNYVKSYESTVAGICNYDYSDSDIATSYAMTMKFAVGSATEFNTTYRIRGYAKLSDGSYVYTDASTYTIYGIADVLYKRGNMNTYATHNYLYTNILSVVNKEYEVVEFDWNSSVASMY